MKEKIFQEKAKIVRKEKLGDKYFKLSVYSPRISRIACPGQFVEIKVAESVEPLLRRPLGVHRVERETFDCLCEIVGIGTELLSKRKAGDCLDVIGPLGNGFSLRPTAYGLRPILVAGGMGVAPLLFLAETLVTKSPSHQVTILLGAKTKKHIICEKEFKKLGCSVKIATDDGSAGFKGYVSELLEKELRAMSACGGSYLSLRAIYACGPKPMLKEIARISKRFDIPAQVSLEEHMACGIGACLGCVVKTKDGFKRVCKEGPVFNAKEIIW